MHIRNNAKISRQDTEGQSGQQNLTRFFKRSNTVLALPKLNQDVKTKFTHGHDIKNLAILALNLMRRGMIAEDAPGETAILVQDAIQKWIADCAGELEYFRLIADLSADLDDLQYSMDEQELSELLENYSEVSGSAPMFLSITPNGISSLTIGEKLQAIEDKVPGLGKTAYYWLATLGARTFEVYTPWAGEGKATQTWWYGEDNQEDYIEALKEYQGEDSEEEIIDEIGPEVWKNSFPKWVTELENPLSVDELEAIAKLNPETLESRVAGVVLKLIENENAQLPAVYDTCLYPVYNSIYLHWKSSDISSRLIDDFVEEINNMGGEGYTEMLGLCAIPNKKKKFDSWMDDMTAGFRQLKNLDTLIHLIGIRDN